MFAGEPFHPGFYISDEDLQGIGLTDELVGPTQEAYADGVDSLYVEELDALIRTEIGKGFGSEDEGLVPGGIYSGAPTLLGGDPVEALRATLNSGNVRDEGTATVNGREVRRLVTHDGFFEYDVDAETFEPVRVRMFGRWQGEVDSPHPLERMVEDVTFEVFEAMPLNEETDDLLEIETPPGTTILEAVGPEDQPPRRER